MLVVIRRHCALTIPEKLNFFSADMYCTSIYRSNVLALYSFYSPEPKCIIQNQKQSSQIWLRSHGLDNPALLDTFDFPMYVYLKINSIYYTLYI